MLDVQNPEIVFTQGYNATPVFYNDIDNFMLCSFTCSEDLISLYNCFDDQEVKDLRLNAFLKLVKMSSIRLPKWWKKSTIVS